MESPLLKLRDALHAAGEEPYAPELWAKVGFELSEAEERWELERELHRDQVRRIRKQRHEYIMLLRKQIADCRDELDAVLRMEAGS